MSADGGTSETRGTSNANHEVSSSRGVCRCYAGYPVALPNAASRGTDDMMHEGRGRLHESCCGCMSAVLRDVMKVAIGHQHEPWRRFKI